MYEVARQSGHDSKTNALFGPEVNGVSSPTGSPPHEAKAADLFAKLTAGMVHTGMVLVFLGIEEKGQSHIPGRPAGSRSRPA